MSLEPSAFGRSLYRYLKFHVLSHPSGPLEACQKWNMGCHSVREHSAKVQAIFKVEIIIHPQDRAT